MSDGEPKNAPERVWLAPDLGDDWSILKAGAAIYWEGIDRHHPDDCETEYVRADIVAARIRQQRDLLDECERALAYAVKTRQWHDPIVKDTLAKLRAQEQADE